jgi:uncharacterized protein YndB with AHSA1/START domain
VGIRAPAAIQHRRAGGRTWAAITPQTCGRYNRTVTEAAKEEITLSRVFDASPELVYRAFVDPDQLCLWFGAEGFSVPCESVQIDARPGGFQRFVLMSDADPVVRSRVDVTFAQVVENELLAGHREVEEAPGSRVMLRLEFHQEAPGKTRLDLRQGPYTEERGEVTKAGWDSSFVRLDSLLRRSL